jgi:predicted MPP superfamily phosphohydrolase
MSGIDRRRFLRIASRTAAVVAIGYPTIAEPYWPVVERHSVAIEGLPPGLDGLRLGVMADFHRGRFVNTGTIAHAVGLLDAEGTDLILLAGDFVEGDESYVPSCMSALSGLRAALGVYAVMGNHDCMIHRRVLAGALKRAHIRLLVNDRVELTWNNQRFHLAGIDDVLFGNPDQERALEGVPTDEVILMAVHEPDFADRLRSHPAWIPLQVSGHSHGGQVRVPFLGSLLLPPLARKYPVGLQPVDGTARQVYTTRGVGTAFFPIRFNCRPEITVLTLRSV